MMEYLKSKKIAMFKLPERLELVDEMPLAASSKIDRRALKQLIEEKLRTEAGEKI
jgi:non-ribosomal peptide synthetase component E (peptide arylation enzyme)